MVISRLKLSNFRSYQLFETQLGPGGTVIIGPNGTGKTNLLEALYVALRGSSFRARLIDCMSFTAQRTIVHLETTAGPRRVDLHRQDHQLNKQFILNHHRTKLLRSTDRWPVVLFEPSELSVLSSSPARRRDFIDGLLSRLDQPYSHSLRAFQRALLQRNELLKQADAGHPQWRDHLFAWDIKFVQLAQQIAWQRASFLQQHQAKLQSIYASLAGQITPLAIDYLPAVALDNYQQDLLDRLDRSRQYELTTGHTSTGPQREDFLISLHQQPADRVASRGEMRTIMLAFKLLELDLQTAQATTRPLILLDDVFSELDATREQLLQEAIQHHQFVVTTTDARHHHDDCLIITTRP